METYLGGEDGTWGGWVILIEKGWEMEGEGGLDWDDLVCIALNFALVWIVLCGSTSILRLQIEI